MADNKKSYKYLHLKNRTKRQQLITPTASLSSLFGGSSSSVNASTSSGQSKKSKMGKKTDKDKPKERWLLTRKTWKYMTDAGRRFIPEYMQNRQTDSQDLKKIEEYFQDVCRNEPKFLPWRRKQSYPGALGTSPFRRSGKLRYTQRLFGRSSTGLAPISGKSNGSSNFSSPRTKVNSADESEDEAGYTANDSQRMFLIIEMLEKYLKLSGSTSPTTADDHDEDNRFSDDLKESILSPNDYSSSATTSPVQTIPSQQSQQQQCDITTSRKNESVNRTTTSTSPPPYQGYRSTSSDERRRFLFDIPTSTHSTPIQTSSRPSNTSPSTYTPRGGTGNQHTSLLLENLRNYGRSNRSSLLSTLNFTPAVLDDKQLLRRIRDELKQQQLDSILRRHSRRPFCADTSNLRLSTSLFMLPTIKSTSSSNLNESNDNVPDTPRTISNDRPSDKIQSETIISPTTRVPLISIKLASQERSPQFNAGGTQTDPIPVNIIYQQYYEYMKQQEKEQSEQAIAKKTNTLSKSMSTDTKLSADTTKHSKRKSSIDNEDVSQSVSDTIKRYLRMARKKPANDNNANQFKRINYDTNLRNITSKAEIPKPEELFGNTKYTQTNDNWCEVVIREIKSYMSTKETPITEFSTDFDDKPQIPPFTSASTPSSPTGFFHTSNKSKESLFGSKKEEGDQRKSGTFNMQKSKSSTNVGQVFSKKIWKSRSKSQTRPDSLAQPHWMPQGNCAWKSASGKFLQLRRIHLQELSDVERKSLQRVALDRINQLNIGVPIKLPPDTTEVLQTKSQKRRAPLLLKRKALTTGFFDSSKIKSDGRKGSTTGTTGGLIFGQPLEKCLSNDNAMSGSKNKNSDDNHKLNRNSRSSITSLDTQLAVGSGMSSDGTYTGSCDSLFSKNDMRFIASNSGESLSDTPGYGNNFDDDTANNKPSGIMRSTQQQVPSLILACIDHLSSYGLNVVGIFRVSTSKRRIRELREELDCGSLKSFDAETSPHDVASLLKEYLRDLPEPLLCRCLYPAFLSTQKIRNRRLQLEALSHLVQLLPVAHRDTLFVLLKFLAHVARCSDDVMNLAKNTCISVGNKMDSANLATVIAPNILHSNTDATSNVASDEQAEERLDVINVVRTMIDHYEEIFAVPADVMDDVYTVMMDTYPQQLDYIFDRKDYYDVNSRKDGDHERDGPSKSPGAQMHTHFFPQQNQDRIDSSDVGMDEPDQPRRMYVREEFTHENTVRGNVNEANDGSIIRRERNSRNKSLIPEHDAFSRRRRREKLPSSSSNNSSPSAEDGFSYNYAILNISPPTSPTHKLNSEHKSKSNEILMASLKLPVQILNATSNVEISAAPASLSLSSDLSDIPYIEDGDNSFRTAPTIPLRQSKSASQTNQLVKKCAFPLTKLKSQYKPQQVQLTTTANNQSIEMMQSGQDMHFPNKQTVVDGKIKKDASRSIFDIRKDASNNIEKSVSQSELGGSSMLMKPRTVETATMYSTEPKLTASITSIGGDVMRSKTAEFERMLIQQNKRNSKSNSIDSSANRRDMKPLSASSSTSSSSTQHSKKASDTLSTTINSNKNDPNVRNGPIYKRRDVISSALNLKK